jgi:hypothetical protein
LAADFREKVLDDVKIVKEAVIPKTKQMYSEPHYPLFLTFVHMAVGVFVITQATGRVKERTEMGEEAKEIHQLKLGILEENKAPTAVDELIACGFWAEAEPAVNPNDQDGGKGEERFLFLPLLGCLATYVGCVLCAIFPG